LTFCVAWLAHLVPLSEHEPNACPPLRPCCG